MSEQSARAPLTPERLAQYTRAAQDVIDSPHPDTRLSIQARDLLALCQEVEQARARPPVAAQGKAHAT
jgi:hypothetical protein